MIARILLLAEAETILSNYLILELQNVLKLLKFMDIDAQPLLYQKTVDFL